MTSFLHQQRLQSVHEVIKVTTPRTVLDLGCGPGPLLQRLAADRALDRIVGVEEDPAVLRRLQATLPTEPGPAAPIVDLIAASIAELDATYEDFDIALLIETIEHMTADMLAKAAKTVFGTLRPRTVIVTTPNIEFNHLLGVPSRRLRHPGHRFEWTRKEFGAWSAAMAGRFSYAVQRRDICGSHPRHGGATQLALFRLETGHAR